LNCDCPLKERVIFVRLLEQPKPSCPKGLTGQQSRRHSGHYSNLRREGKKLVEGKNPNPWLGPKGVRSSSAAWVDQKQKNDKREARAIRGKVRGQNQQVSHEGTIRNLPKQNEFRATSDRKKKKLLGVDS